MTAELPHIAIAVRRDLRFLFQEKILILPEKHSDFLYSNMLIFRAVFQALYRFR
ncbi:hypothetical protein GJV44_00002 [Candidatus Vallotia cooleyia]|nr:hypothetical protein GJV44_00002 [Candidatus Vallotia cooleyia]